MCVYEFCTHLTTSDVPKGGVNKTALVSIKVHCGDVTSLIVITLTWFETRRLTDVDRESVETHPLTIIKLSFLQQTFKMSSAHTFPLIDLVKSAMSGRKIRQ